jgi:hypothetical protein
MQNKEVNTVIQESQIFGPIGSYMWLSKADQLLIEAHENYQKRSFRNRYQILTTNGPLSLSIPLAKGKNQQMPIQEVLISYDEDWSRSHIQTIKSSYGKSPYFEFYFYDIEALLLKKYEKLLDMNYASLILMLKFLKLNKQISKTDTFVKSYDKSEYLDNRNTQYDRLQYRQYHQVWDHKYGFQKNLSIIDLLFCKGPESNMILKETLAMNLSLNDKSLVQ